MTLPFPAQARRPALLVALLLLLLPPLASLAPPARADHHKEPGSAPPAAAQDVQLYRPELDRLVGRVSIPDQKLAVLVQPEGREWREFRTVILRTVAGVLIVGILAALLLFYLWRGRIPIRAGRSGRTIRRFSGIERAGHWLTAVSFLVLALSGLAVTFGRPLLIPLMGHEAFTALAQAAKYAHNFFSVPFVLGLLLILVLWIRDNLPERADLAWIRAGGGLLGGPGSSHPESGRFNAGQKLIFWSVVLGGAALAVSGYMLMAPFYLTGVGGMQTAHVVHAVVAALLIVVAIAHIYIGTLGMEGAFDAMASGRVDENWAREHHSRWYEEAAVARGEGGPGRGGHHQARTTPAE